MLNIKIFKRFINNEHLFKAINDLKDLKTEFKEYKNIEIKKIDKLNDKTKFIRNNEKKCKYG
jgi:hypothetical protein